MRINGVELHFYQQKTKVQVGLDLMDLLHQVNKKFIKTHCNEKLEVSLYVLGFKGIFKLYKFDS